MRAAALHIMKLVFPCEGRGVFPCEGRGAHHRTSEGSSAAYRKLITEIKAAALIIVGFKAAALVCNFVNLIKS